MGAGRGGGRRGRGRAPRAPQRSAPGNPRGAGSSPGSVRCPKPTWAVLCWGAPSPGRRRSLQHATRTAAHAAKCRFPPPGPGGGGGGGGVGRRGGLSGAPSRPGSRRAGRVRDGRPESSLGAEGEWKPRSFPTSGAASIPPARLLLLPPPGDSNTPSERRGLPTRPCGGQAAGEARAHSSLQTALRGVNGVLRS